MNEKTKICLVCGDKALGKNFCVISCESCKAFFRRNAGKLNECNKCPFNDKCEVNVQNRRFCRRCRLRKCYAVGMKHEWILNIEDKEKRKNKIEENRKTRQTSDTIVQTLATAGDEVAALSCLSLSHITDQSSIELFNTISFSESNETTLDIISSITDTNYTTFNETEVIVDDINDCISSDTYRRAVELELAVLPIDKPLVTNQTTLTEAERNKLMELFSQTATIRIHNYQPNTKIMATNIAEVTLYLQTKFELFLTTLIRIVKRLQSFANLCTDDQLALIKYGCIEALLIYIPYFYDNHQEHFTLYIDSDTAMVFQLDLLKHIKRNAYFVFKNYLNNFMQEWDTDPYVIDLLVCITMFNPNRPSLIHRELVKVQQHLYTYLLQRYLQIRYNGSVCHSKTKLLKLLNFLQDVKLLNEIYKSNISEEHNDQAKLGPLLTEILDLPYNSLI